jgi:hypothetical protein
MLAGDPINAIKFWKRGWQYAKEVEHVVRRRFLARSFAVAAERAGGVVPGSTKWPRANGISLRLGKDANVLLRVR